MCVQNSVSSGSDANDEARSSSADDGVWRFEANCARRQLCDSSRDVRDNAAYHLENEREPSIGGSVREADQTQLGVGVERKSRVVLECQSEAAIKPCFESVGLVDNETRLRRNHLTPTQN